MIRDISNLRKSYSKNSIVENDLPKDPFFLFDTWFKQVNSTNKKSEVNAMTLSTIDSSGYPVGRIVLLKYYSRKGFVFFTNYNSNKSISIDKNNKVSISFFWENLERQVIIKGHANKTPEDVSSKYFASRPLGSKLGAIVSENQSSIIESKEYIIKRYNKLKEDFKGKEIPRPKNWGGFIIEPIQYEFWQGGENRLHDRIRYSRNKNLWKMNRLSP